MPQITAALLSEIEKRRALNHKRQPEQIALRKQVIRAMRAAHKAVFKAREKGTLLPQPCFVCGKAARVEAHHSSYAADMRLAVTWLCTKHHNEAHTNA